MHLVADRWYVAVTSIEVPTGAPVARRRLGQELVLWRDERGVVHAALDRCPHRGARLSPGRLRGGCLECPFHGFRFDGSGSCVSIPAHPDRPISPAMALATVHTREAHGFVWIWTGVEAPDDTPIPFFDFEGYAWTGSAMTVPVATHYARGIENQLDFAHLPFVHRTTIGRMVDLSGGVELQTEVDGDRIAVRLVDSDEGAVQFLGPNIWRNRTGAAWQFLAFVPIDEAHMLYYVRTYQGFVRAPILAWVVGKLNATLNGFVIPQDTRVVETQPPGEVRLRMGEVLVRSDQPIIAYRRWREAHRAPFDPGAGAPGAARVAEGGA